MHAHVIKTTSRSNIQDVITKLHQSYTISNHTIRHYGCNFRDARIQAVESDFRDARIQAIV